MRTLLISLMLSVGVSVWAAGSDTAPDALVRTASNDVVSAIAKDHLTAGDKRFQDMLDAKALPNFDFTRITALAVGRHWRDATTDQQTAVIREFRTLLIKSYSTALTTSKIKTIDVKPVQLNDGDRDVVVNSVITPIDGQPFKIDYHMVKLPEGWKIDDVRVEGVSLVTNYRTQFNDKINQGGMDALIKDLIARNAAPAKS